MLKRLFKFLDNNIYRRELEQFRQLVDKINALEPALDALPEGALAEKSAGLRARLQQGDDSEELIPAAFALVRTAAKRTIGLRPYDVQMIGGAVLQRGGVAEMRTGEGKTLVAVAPLYLSALEGQGAHLITVNDYLARRDARWMGPIFHLLGLSVGVLQSGGGGGETPAYRFDPGQLSPVEIEHQLLPVPRHEAYLADITYGTNSEFGFDYLRDNLAGSPAERVQRGHHYAIIDEVDNVLIDEARTPLIIAGQNANETIWYARMAAIAGELRSHDVQVNRKDEVVNLSPSGERRIESLLGLRLGNPGRPGEATPRQRHLLGHLEQALRARYLYQRDRDYLVQNGEVIIIDEFTGRQMPGRRWTDGLHQAVEAKEGLEVQAESITHATVSLQNYFRMYQRLAGMTGTALAATKEFEKIYKLSTHPIPTHVEYQAFDPRLGLEERQGQTEDGQPFQYYVHKDDRLQKPVFWKRIDYPDVVFRTLEAKTRGLAWEVLRGHLLGQPLLVGTTSVADSELLSAYLEPANLRRLALTRLLRRAWLAANPSASALAPIPALSFTARPLGLLDLNRLNGQAASLGLDPDPTAPANLDVLLQELELPAETRSTLAAALQNGIPNQVLNARRHYEESQIIAGAGAPGAVTIATNMAGRGVDIKLGGELAEEVSAAVSLVLERAGRADVYNLTLPERLEALQALPASAYGAHQAEVDYFIAHMAAMQLAHDQGGLHVIGGTRHEARRIDQQLRGRAARQGDPGSSRFYVSLEDDLLVRFGGLEAQEFVASLEQRDLDSSLPLPAEAARKVVEAAQNRAESENYEIRKRTLEYDDVLNAQRLSIYRQRDRILDKPDLSEDIHAMLADSLDAHIAQYVTAEGQPWKLLEWLEQIQPTLPIPALSPTEPGASPRFIAWPTWALQRVIDAAPFEGDYVPSADLLLDIVRDAVQADQAYLLEIVKALLQDAHLQLSAQVEEKLDVVNTFLGNLEPEDVTGQPRQLISELGHSLGFPVTLTGQGLRRFTEDPYSALEELQPQVEAAVYADAAAGLQSAVESLLGAPLELPAGPAPDWDILARRLELGARQVLDRNAEKLLGAGALLPQRLTALTAGLTFPLHLDLACFLLEDLRRPSEPPRRSSGQAGSPLPVSGEGVGGEVSSSSHSPGDAPAATPLPPLPPGNAPAATALPPLPVGEGVGGEVRSALPLFSYHHLAARGLQGLSPDEIADEAESHLLEALELVRTNALGGDLNGHYRRTLLGVIDEHWIEFLNEMEALRYEVRLEGMAQRDPVVVYKSSAAERFARLLSDLREETVARLYQFGPQARSKFTAESSIIEQPDPKRIFLKLG